MTVSTITARISYTANGVQTAFSFPYFAQAAADFVVSTTDADGVETLKTLSTHYTVSGAGTAWTITFNTAPTSGHVVAILRDPSPVQETDFESEGAPLDAMNDSTDRVAAMLQALRDSTVKKSPGTPTGFDPALPNTIGADAGDVIALNSTKTGFIWAVITTVGTVATALRNFVLSSTLLGARRVLGDFDTRTQAAAATIDSTLTTITVAGYTTAGDGGAARYVRAGSAPSHNAYFQSADGAYWVLDETVVDIRMLGAVNSLASNSRTAIQNAIGYVEAEGGDVYIPIGQFRIDTGLTITKPIRVFGSGSGGGPGAVTNANCSQIVANFLSGDVIAAVTDYAVTFEHFQITSNVGARSSGAGIHISGDAVNNANSVINDVAFNQQYVDIHHTDCNENLVTQTYHQAWVRSAYLNSSNGTEVGAGDINCSYFFGETTSGTTQTACVECHSGYTRITNSLLLGAQRGILWDIDEIDAGSLMARGNHIEEQALVGIDALNNALDVASGEKLAAMLQFQGNEFSNVTNTTNFIAHIRIAAGDASWIKLIQLQGNTYKSQLASGDYFILINTGETVEISGETMDNAGAGTPTGITIGAQVTKAQVQDNILTGTYGTRYSLTTECTFRDFASALTVAQLPSCRDGSLAWVTDGQPKSVALQGSGSGCIAERRGNGWIGAGASARATIVSSDAAYTIPDGVAEVLHAGTLTANRAVTFATNMNEVLFTRIGGGAFNLTFSPTNPGAKNLATNTWAHFKKDSNGNWYTAAAGSL